jgi:REP element-mobilizing transposase RayT
MEMKLASRLNLVTSDNARDLDRLGAPASPPAPANSASSSSSASPWRSRGYLPHFDQPRLVQSLTFRLHDAVPESVIESWKRELSWIENLPSTDPRDIKLRNRISRYEDAGHGACWLREERVAALVENTLLHFDGERYRLIAWSIMPNHVHALIELREEWPVTKIAHSWKSYTAHAANEILGRSGDFWFREYFDRFIRDDRHFRSAVSYIERNPVKAGLVRLPEEWRWGSAWGQREGKE